MTLKLYKLTHGLNCRLVPDTEEQICEYKDMTIESI